MKQYELLYSVSGELTDAELKTLRTRIDGMLTARTSAVTVNDYAGKAKLGYPIGPHRFAHFVLVRFKAEPAAITALDADLRLDNDVIRHMIVSAEDVPLMATVTLMRPPEEERPALRPETAPVAAAPLDMAATPLSQEDIDKKIDEMLTEAVK